MVRIDSWKVKFIVLSMLVTISVFVFSLPNTNGKALASIGMLLLIEAYFLGIDSTIVGRIVKMKPFNRIINGMYWIIMGFMSLVIMVLGQYAFFQWGFAVFLCLAGVSILIYQSRVGAKWSFMDVEGAIALRQLLEKKRREKFERRLQKELDKRRDKKFTPKQLEAFEADQRKKFEANVGGGYGLRLFLKKYIVYTYLISLGSDLSVAAIFFVIFALIDFGTAFFLFVFGFIVRYTGDLIAKKVGVVKEEALPESVSQR